MNVFLISFLSLNKIFEEKNFLFFIQQFKFPPPLL